MSIVHLYHADCWDALQNIGLVDAVITDPPYGIGYDRDAESHVYQGGTRVSYGPASGWDDERPDQRIFDLMLSKLKPGGVAIIWGGNYFTDMLPPSMRWLVWDKMAQNFSMADCEFAWTNQWRASRIFRYSRGAHLTEPTRQHPAQKPLALMEWCLRIADMPAVVLDPFMGAGTTGVACKHLGLEFIGIEREQRYFDIANARIARMPEQLEIKIA